MIGRTSSRASEETKKVFAVLLAAVFGIALLVFLVSHTHKVDCASKKVAETNAPQPAYILRKFQNEPN